VKGPARTLWSAVVVVAALAVLAPPRTDAAEWTLAPVISAAIDDDSNRSYATEAIASQSLSLTAGAACQRRTDTTQLTLTPLLTWQRYDSAAYTPIFNRALNVAFEWTQELSTLDLTGGFADESTLQTELETTGLISTHVHRRLGQGAVSWSYSQTERRALVLSLSYGEATYYGSQEQLLNLLSGYRQPSASLGERFILSETSSLTPSVFTDQLLTNIPGQNSRETGAQIDYTHSFSERTKLDVSVGGSSRTLQGVASTGTIANVQFTHSYERGGVTAGYTRGLVPYGTGVLAQQQRWSLATTYNLTEYLTGTAAFVRTQNDAPPLANFGARVYNNLTLGLDWRLLPDWAVHTEVGATRTETVTISPQPVNEWRVLLSLRWSPLLRPTPGP
jgi:hypothetical protein